MMILCMKPCSEGIFRNPIDEIWTLATSIISWHCFIKLGEGEFDIVIANKNDMLLIFSSKAKITYHSFTIVNENDKVESNAIILMQRKEGMMLSSSSSEIIRLGQHNDDFTNGLD